MALRFFRARTLTTFLAGLAATSISSPGLNGFGTPLRAGWAGFLITTILHRPGIWNAPVPFLPSALPISALRASKTAATSFLERFVAVEMFANTSDLPAALGLDFLAIGCHPPCEVHQETGETGNSVYFQRIGGKL